MSRSKFNELYIGVALIINGTAPANATLQTDDEMRNIKAMWHIAKIEHSYWIPGYVYYTYYKLRISFKLPYVYLAWVPPYKLWGWIPIPGHFEPRLGWYQVNIERTIRIPHYQPPRKVTYYTYEKVYDFNWSKAKKVGIGVGACVGYGVTMIIGAVTTIPTGGSSWVVIGYGLVYATSALGTATAVEDAWNADKDPTWI